MTTDALTRPAMSERDLHAAIVEMARWLHWRTYWTHRSDHSPAGYPDLTMIRARPGEAPRLLIAELKRPGKRPTMAQRAWLDDFEALADSLAVVGYSVITVALWTPADWHNGTIEAVLRGDAR